MGVTVHDEPDAILPQCRELVRPLDEGAGVIVFSDVCGATPCNIASQLAQPGKVELVAGVNLPMLLRPDLPRQAAGRSGGEGALRRARGRDAAGFTRTGFLRCSSVMSRS